MKFNKGFLTVAENSRNIDYLKLAYGLALSIKATQECNNISVLVSPGMVIPKKYSWIFDEIIEFPWGDENYGNDRDWKFKNEWKAYHITPYEQTIKIEADMLIPKSIDHWWDLLDKRKLWFTSNVRTYRNDIITSDACRKVFTSAQLPNIYNGLMYFKKDDEVQEFFDLAETIFKNGKIFFDKYLDHNAPDIIATDEVYALTLKILGREHNYIDQLNIPTFVHMKPELQNWNVIIDNWNKMVQCFVTENLEIFVNNYEQIYPFHYHNKDFLTDEIIQLYEEKLNGK